MASGTSGTILKREMVAADKAERTARAVAQRQAADERRPVGTSTWAVPETPKPALTTRQRKRAKAAEKVNADARLVAELVPAEALKHGAYLVQTVPGPSIVVGGKEKITTMKVVLNRGGTAVDRWIAGDRAGLFEEPQQAAIAYVRNLWTRASATGRAIDLTVDRVDAPLGWSQNEALDELMRLKDGVPRAYWEVFENVCRFDEEAGVAGSRLATNSRSAVDAAKITVAFTASLVAMRKGF
jgi:hypothetical protein